MAGPRWLRNIIHAKWPSNEEKEWWYTKLSGVRTTKLKRLWLAQDGKCHYCKRDCWQGASEDDAKFGRERRATLDHVIPQSQGGTDALRNLVMACYSCNSARGTMDYALFVQLTSTQVSRDLFLVAKRRQREWGNPARASKRLERQTEMALRLGILFFYFPELADWADKVLLELNA